MDQVHNVFEHDKNDQSQEKILREKLGALADIVHVHARSDIELISSHYYIPLEKYLVAPHGNYKGFYLNNSTYAQCRDALDITPADKVFLFFGMLRPYKGLEELIAAFSQFLQQAHPEGAFAHCRKNYQRLYDSLLSFIAAYTPYRRSFVDNDHIQDDMNAADFCVFPYKNIFDFRKCHAGVIVWQACDSPQYWFPVFSY